jgi:hypothetical protein
MNNPKNTQYLVLSPRAYDSGWTRAECHTEAEAFAVAADLAERGRPGPHRRYRRRNLPPVYPPRAGHSLATNEGPRNGPHHTKQNWRI